MFIKNEQKSLAYQMLVFDEVVKRGSFTAAAEAIGHTKSAISQYVSQLEKALEIRLLNRSTRRLSLTAAGQALAKRSEQLVTLLTTTLEEMEAQGQAPSGRLAITAPHAFEQELITPLITELMSEFPDIRPELIYSDQRLDLIKHQLDLAISIGEQKDSSYHAIPVGALESILVSSPSYIAQHDAISVNNFSEQILITLPWQKKLYLTSDNGEQLAFAAVKSIQVNTTISAINCTLCGGGISLVPSIFVEKHLARGELQRVLVNMHGPSRSVYALHSYGQKLPLVLRCFIDRLKNRFSIMPKRTK